jgi:hypothetical protein
MTTVLVITGDEFTHHAVRLRLLEHDDFIQQFPAQGSAKPPHIRILPRRPQGRPHRLHAQVLEIRGHFVAILAIPVRNHVARRCVERKRFAQLPDDPRRLRMLGHGKVQLPPSFVVQH